MECLTKPMKTLEMAFIMCGLQGSLNFCCSIIRSKFHYIFVTPPDKDRWILTNHRYVAFL